MAALGRADGEGGADLLRMALAGTDHAGPALHADFQGFDLAWLLAGRFLGSATAAPIFSAMAGSAAQIGRLTVCPTPIGNPRDITLRTLDVLREADAIACEDTRRTGLLLDHHRLRGPHMTLVSVHEHNERERTADLLRRVRAGQKVALVSDAGMPLISDPGFPLVQAAIAEGLPVEVLPGPSALLTALVASGLPASRFRFEGFLPRKKADLDRLLRGSSETIVAFESPRRLAASLAALAKIEAKRMVVVCRELSKLHEEVVRGDAGELARRYAMEAPRGEVVLVIAPSKHEGDWQEACDALASLMRSGAKLRPAARVVASLTGVSANALYQSVAERKGRGVEEQDHRARRDEPAKARRSDAASLRRP